MSTEGHDFDALLEVKTSVLTFTCLQTLSIVRRDNMLFVCSLIESCNAE